MSRTGWGRRAILPLRLTLRGAPEDAPEDGLLDWWIDGLVAGEEDSDAGAVSSRQVLPSLGASASADELRRDESARQVLPSLGASASADELWRDESARQAGA